VLNLLARPRREAALVAELVLRTANGLDNLPAPDHLFIFCASASLSLSLSPWVFPASMVSSFYAHVFFVGLPWILFLFS